MKKELLTVSFTKEELEALTYWIFLGQITYDLNKKQSKGEYKVPKHYPENIKKIRNMIFEEMHKQGFCDGKDKNCRSKKCPYKKQKK